MFHVFNGGEDGVDGGWVCEVTSRYNLGPRIGNFKICVNVI